MPLLTRHVVSPAQFQVYALSQFNSKPLTDELGFSTWPPAQRLAMLQRQDNSGVNVGGKIDVFRSKCSGVELKCVRANLRNPDFLAHIGRVLVQVAQVVPGGILMFLPSYALLDNAAKVWRREPYIMRNNENNGHGNEQIVGNLNGGRNLGSLWGDQAARGRPFRRRKDSPKTIWEALETVKQPICLEEKDPLASDASRALYIANASTGTGALMIAVYRGKMSEGLSLSDALCRAVVCVGIPYPSLGDAKIIKKKAFNDALAAGKETPASLLWRAADRTAFVNVNKSADRLGPKGSSWLDGKRWYAVQAFKALNQAIGRVVRHR